uniref:KIB1-4 beta-propeller domain-containing protein n=1 Tax=Leersia perrieri TaxID=77586 RepID=A0A0D9W287_9ORYZ
MAVPAEMISKPDWSCGLPHKVLESIAKKLSSGCCLLPPVLILPFDPESSSEGNVTFYSITEDKAINMLLPEVHGKVVCGVSHGWLALMDEAASVTLLNPFTRGRVMLPPADRNVALASFKTVSMVDGGWVLHYVSGDTKPIKLQNMRDIFFREIVLSAPPASGPSGGADCKAMAVLTYSTEIAFCCFGDSSWTLIDSKLEYPVSSIVHCQDKFIAIGSLGEISILSGTTDGTAPLTASPLLLLPPPANIQQRSYMDVNGQLYLVGSILRVSCGAWYETVVHKCDILGEMPCWLKVTDAEDMAFFVSQDFSTGFGVASISNTYWNCVYLSEHRNCHQEESINHHLEIVNITTNQSDLQAYHPIIPGLEALCWIRPNIWN